MLWLARFNATKGFVKVTATERLHLSCQMTVRKKKALGRFPKLPFPGYNTYKQAKTETK